jgi:AcrR family transcriptional regulator
VRAIADRAGVDPALVHHYFGTKEQLFVSVMRLPFDPQRITATVLAAGEAFVGERLVRALLEVWERPEARSVMAGLLGSAMSDPTAAAMLRDALFRSGGLADLAGALGRSDPELRTVLVGSQIMGIFVARWVARFEPLASADREVIVAAVAPTIQRYLTGDISELDARVRARW